MADDIFLKLEGIEGECTDHKHSQWIEIDSYGFGVAHTGGTGTGGTGRASFDELIITKHLDCSSSNLMLASATGKHIESATIEACQATKEKHVCMRIKLKDVLINSYKLGSDKDGHHEEFSLNYASIEFEYIPINEAGKPQAARRMNWHLGANR